MRTRPEGDPFSDLTQSDWEKASDALLDGDRYTPFSIAADLQSGRITGDEAHEMVLGWLNLEGRR